MPIIHTASTKNPPTARTVHGQISHFLRMVKPVSFYVWSNLGVQELRKLFLLLEPLQMLLPYTTEPKSGSGQNLTYTPYNSGGS